MRNLILVSALLGVTALAGCTDRPINAQCTGVGIAAGAALGAATNNNVAQSAVAGGILGAIAGDSGACN